MYASVLKTGLLYSDGVASSPSICGGKRSSAYNVPDGHDNCTTAAWTWHADVFENMLENGIPLDHITYVSVLSSCSHSRLVEQGRRYFDSMTRVHKITPQNEHYACMVDMFGRTYLLTEAKQFIQ
jgi:pentatricopeptide repeat protein